MSTRSRKPLSKLDAPPLPGVKAFKPSGLLPQTPPATSPVVCDPDAAGALRLKKAGSDIPVDGLNALPTPAQGPPNLTDAKALWALARS